MDYLKIWTNFSEIMEPLDDAEKGRLFTAMLAYAASGEQPSFSGNERFVWPAARQAIDRTRAENERMSAIGAKGGRPKNRENRTEPDETGGNLTKPTETYENLSKPTETYENLRKPTESHKEKKYKEKESNEDDDDTARARETPFGPVELDPVILALQENLIGMAMQHYDDLDGYRDILPDELIIEAVNEAVAHGARTWAYVRSILQSYVKENIRSVGDARARSEKAKGVTQGGKKVSAQMYTQRVYTEEELEGRVDEL